MKIKFVFFFFVSGIMSTMEAEFHYYYKEVIILATMVLDRLTTKTYSYKEFKFKADECFKYHCSMQVF